MNRQSASAETIPSPMVPVRPRWLASRQEAVVEPGRELVEETSGRYLGPGLLEDITGSGHRVARAGCGWERNAPKRLASACEAKNRALFSGSARRVYHLAQKAA